MLPMICLCALARVRVRAYELVLVPKRVLALETALALVQGIPANLNHQ